MPIQSGQQAEVPIVRYAPQAIYIDGISITAQRSDSSKNQYTAEKSDNIIISISADGNGTFSTYLTPAVLVHIVNTQLSDEERAFIRHAPDERDAQIVELNGLDQLGSLRGVGAP